MCASEDCFFTRAGVFLGWTQAAQHEADAARMAAMRSGRLMGMDMGMDLDHTTTGKRKKGKKGGWDGYGGGGGGPLSLRIRVPGEHDPTKRMRTASHDEDYMEEDDDGRGKRKRKGMATGMRSGGRVGTGYVHTHIKPSTGLSPFTQGDSDVFSWGCVVPTGFKRRSK